MLPKPTKKVRGQNASKSNGKGERPVKWSGSSSLGRLPGKVEEEENQILRYALLIGLITGLAVLLYFLFKFYRKYRIAKNVEPQVKLIYPTPAIVGQTLTCRIRFREKGQRSNAGPTATFEEIQSKCTLLLASTEGIHEEIAILKEVNFENQFITGKFSVRKSGSYKIIVKYDMLKMMPTHPYYFNVLPGSPYHRQIDFGSHNPTMLCVTSGFIRTFKISVKDEYGNSCLPEAVDVNNFAFSLFEMGSLIQPVHCEFVYNNDIADLTSTEDVDPNLPPQVCLKLRIDNPGIYICALSYNGHEVPYVKDIAKQIVCITLPEETDLLETFNQKLNPGNILYSCPCNIQIVGDHDEERRELLVGVTSTYIAFADFRLALPLYPIYKFPMNARTKMIFSWSHHVHGEMHTVQFLLEDGVRQKTWVEVDAISARKLLVAFAHVQGFTISKLGFSFQAKKTKLQYEITPFFPRIVWLNPEKIINVHHGKLIPGSIAAAPSNPSDWLLKFNVRFDDSTGSKISTQEWLNSLTDEIFSENEGFFRSYPPSKLHHPQSSTISRQPIEHYKFCGQVLAKCIVEMLLRGCCTRLNTIKFTKSFLAYMLGFPISYKFLETDDPTYFRRVKPIIEADLTNSNYMFTTLPEPDSRSSPINLVPNGSEVRVYNEHKEHYLNLLTRHHFIHAVEQEISAIRSGFYSVLDPDKLCDFHEDDLQQLLSGGCSFNVNDFKNNYRVVREEDNGHANPLRRHANIDMKKIIEWFFIAVQNMTEKEKSFLMLFTTGGYSLPSCGFRDLNPIFTISLTGTYNQLPRANPESNEIILGDQTNFDQFERSLLVAIKPESERLDLPQTSLGDRLILDLLPRPNDLVPSYQETEENDEGEDVHGPLTRLENIREALTNDPFVDWLREMIHL